MLSSISNINCVFCDHSISLAPCWAPKMPISTLDILWFIAASQPKLNWAGTVIQLDVSYFSPLTWWSFEQHYVSSHQRPPFLKSVSLVWLESHSSAQLWTTACRLVALSFLILAWSHQSCANTLRSPGSKWAFVNICLSLKHESALKEPSKQESSFY